MKIRYTDDELLMLSGLQHFVFCPRQWYLIHIEQLWDENELTILGQILHQRVNKPEQSERRGNIVTLRSVPLVSYKLGLYGFSDAVELHPASVSDGPSFTHPKYPGHWDIIPVEYKKGRPKRHNADRLQLCAEAACLEEAYSVHIPFGYLFYGEIRHREQVIFDQYLRSELIETTERMHEVFANKETIPAVYSGKCRSCSLINQCLPKMNQKGSASSYLKRNKLFTP